MKNRLLSSVFALGLSACAVVDTGQVDYRVAAPPPSAAEVEQLTRECEKPSSAVECRQITAVPLVRKYIAAQAPFQLEEVYSIELEQAVMGTSILEGNVFGKQFGKRGEFAILANAFEFGKEGTTRRFLDATEYEAGKADPDVELKLIFYGDDIARQQAFNFSNIPLMPRAVYRGGSVGIQIVIMEVDSQSQPVTSLLKTLAKFGQRAVPGPPEAVNILFDLGESLLQGSQDDRILDYRFVMSSGAAVDAEGKLGPVATFAPGRYVFFRAQDRVTDIGWRTMTFDYNTGRLFNADHTEFRRDLYFVLNVRKYPKGTEPESFATRSWSQLQTAVQEAADAKGKPIEALTRDLTTLLAVERSNKWRSLLTERWVAAESRLRKLASASLSIPADVTVACPAAASKARMGQDIAERDAQDALRAFLEDYRSSLTPATPDAEAFKSSDREQVVSLVARYFMPWADSPEIDRLKASFGGSSAFETAYVTSADGALFADARAAAIRRGRTVSTCAELEQVTT